VVRDLNVSLEKYLRLSTEKRKSSILFQPPWIPMDDKPLRNIHVIKFSTSGFRFCPSMFFNIAG